MSNFRYTEGDPSRMNSVSLYKMLFMMSELRMRYDNAKGTLYVWDLNNLKFGHIMKITPQLVHNKLLILQVIDFLKCEEIIFKKHFFQNCYSYRIKGVYVVNLPSLAKHTLELAMSFGIMDIPDGFCICHSLQELHCKYIDIQSLPTELGGPGYYCKTIAGNHNSIYYNYFIFIDL
jgi:hypothetical protein